MNTENSQANTKVNDAKSKEEKDFIEGLEGVYAKGPGLSAWVFPLAFFIFIAVVITWLYLSETEVVSMAQFKIISNKGLHSIQPKEQAKILNVPVKQGDSVQENDVLAYFEKEELEIEIEGIESEIAITKASIYRYESILNRIDGGRTGITKISGLDPKILRLEKSVIKSQMDLFYSEIDTFSTKIDKAEAEKKKLKAELLKLKNIITLKDERIIHLEPLVSRKYRLRDDLDKTKEERTDKQGEKHIKERQYDLIRSEIDLKKQERDHYADKFYHEKNEKLLENYQQLKNLENKLKRAKESLKNRTIYSPIEGTIHNVLFHTKGTVVRQADIMMHIIPKDSILKAEAKVLNRDIGFVKLNQAVKVKFDSFPFTKYGYMEGEISKIERAAVKDEQLGDIYPVVINLDMKSILKIDGREILLIPGMTGSVDIKTGKRRMIDFILAPFIKYGDEALNKR